MKIRIITLSIALGSFGIVYGQNNTVTTGGTASGSGGLATYTIGQSFYLETGKPSNYMIEGMQQPYEINVHISVEEYNYIFLSLSAYPNPTSDILTISRSSSDGGVLNAGLFDVSGRLVLLENMAGISHNLSMNNLLRSFG